MQAKSGTAARLDFGEQPQPEPSKRSRTSKRANELDGATWTKYSLSVWSDIKKSSDEYALRHPAMFPVMLVRRLIQCFTTSKDQVVLDPFSGSGSTLIGAMLENKKGIGLEIVPSYIELTKHRIADRHLPYLSKVAASGVSILIVENFLDLDTAYLLGLIVIRGRLIETGGDHRARNPSIPANAPITYHGQFEGSTLMPIGRFALALAAGSARKPRNGRCLTLNRRGNPKHEDQ